MFLAYQSDSQSNVQVVEKLVMNLSHHLRTSKQKWSDLSGK